MKKLVMFSTFMLLSACRGSMHEVGKQAPGTGAETGGPAGPAGPAGGASGTPTGAASGAEMTYSGYYDVPVPPELAAAATYRSPEVHWTVLNGTARLEYNLPKGLVGGSVGVDFSGPFDPATGKGTLTGPAGTSECTATTTTVSCTETMYGILPIDVDMDLVAAIAEEEYAGPIEHRIDVTQRFIGDPIGIVRFELNTGVVEADHGPEHDLRDDN
jgi:hypothetical protein